MKNAVAIILGANLGTTLASWLIATFGVKTNIEVIANSLKIIDPIIDLLTFSTLINFFANVLFLLVLVLFTQLLKRFFKNTNSNTAAFISHGSITKLETSLYLFEEN